MLVDWLVRGLAGHVEPADQPAWVSTQTREHYIKAYPIVPVATKNSRAANTAKNTQTHHHSMTQLLLRA